MSTSERPSLLERLELQLAGMEPATSVAEQLEGLVEAGLDALPMPGDGQTLQRWQALAMVAQHDLSLAKLYEGHTDALAIMTETGGLPPSSHPERGGVWAAESGKGRVVLQRRGDGQVLLSGTKNWCSGAKTASHALLTAWEQDGSGPQLVHVRLRQAGVQVIEANWHAVGMAESSSLDVQLEGADGRLVGAGGDYPAVPVSGMAVPALRPAGSAARGGSHGCCGTRWRRLPRPAPRPSGCVPLARSISPCRPLRH